MFGCKHLDFLLESDVSIGCLSFSCSSIVKKENTHDCMTDCTYVLIYTCIYFSTLNSESIYTLATRSLCVLVSENDRTKRNKYERNTKNRVSHVCMHCCYRERRCFVYCCVIFSSLRVFNVNKFLNNRTECCTSTDTFDICLTRCWAAFFTLKRHLQLIFSTFKLV